MPTNTPGHRRPNNAPRRIPLWAWSYYAWIRSGRKGPRPEDAPARIPLWFWAWYTWRRLGGHTSPSPIANAIQLPTTFVPTHQTGGLPGYPAIDVFGKSGVGVRAPSDGVVRYVHMIDWNSTARVGGWTMYLDTPQGTYFLTHFGQVFVRDGVQIKRGQALGTIAAVPHGWWASHIHEGFHRA